MAWTSIASSALMGMLVDSIRDIATSTLDHDVKAARKNRQEAHARLDQIINALIHECEDDGQGGRDREP